MANLTSINLTLYQILTKSQETVLVISKQLQALQSQSKENKPTTNKHSMDKKTRDKNQRVTAGLMVGPAFLTILAQPADTQIQDTK